MNIPAVTTKAGEQVCKAALDSFLHEFLTPAFGALPKGEIELQILKLLVELDAIGKNPSIYELVSKLKITRAKARKLIYDRELRTRTTEDLDNEVRELLKNPLIQKSGESFVLEVENPLVADHLRSKLKRLNHVTDGSFSPSIVSLTLNAIVALIEDEVPESDQKHATASLIAAGAPEKTFRGILKATLKKLGSKIASDTGDAVAEQVSDYVGPFIDGTVELAKDKFKIFFGKVEK